MKVALICFYAIVTLMANAGEKIAPRHTAKGGNHIIELVPGTIFHNNKTDFSLGIDYEYFPHEDHHFSFGVSFEKEYMLEREYFFGPHFAWYFLGHNKVFYASGFGWNHQHTFWKNNLGLGHEFIFKNHFVLVPSIVIEHSPEATHTLISIGLGFEF